MTFPAVPRDYTVELFLNGGWRDVSSDVRAADGINITRGRPNEASQPQPATCSMTLDNRSGNYSPRNPLGAWYGMLGRNTPIRVSVNLVRDTFTRTSTNDWGLTDTGHDWSHSWSAGGSVDDFDVTGGVGTQSVSAAGGLRHATLPNETYRDVSVTMSFTMPFVDVLGGSITSGIMVRRNNATVNYYFCDLQVNSSEQMFIRWSIVIGGVSTIISSNAVTGFTYTAQRLRMTAQVSGQTLRAKVWPSALPEPFGWDVVTSDEVITGAGIVGFRSDVFSGNTNTLPGVFAYDDIVIRSVRFVGEIASWPQRWDTSGKDITAPIEASSLLRRLAQGSAPLLSTIHRAITGLTIPAVAYWPAEEGGQASSISSAVGGPAMTLTGTTDFAAYSEIPSSLPLPVLGTGSSWTGEVTPYTGTGSIELRFLMRVPVSAPDLAYICEITTGGGRTWSILHHTGGAISIELWEYSTRLRTTGPIGFDVGDKKLAATLLIEQNGTAIDYEFRTLEIGSVTGGFWSDSQPSRTLQRALRVRINPHAELTGVALGHISVRKESSEFYDLAEELNAFTGEFATIRMLRLCDQNNVDLSLIFDPAGGTLVGPQRPLSLLTLLQECADADLGTLSDVRSDSAVLYRERASLYAQAPVLTLDYTGGQIAAPFQPVDDDQRTRNDVTVTRTEGGSARAVLEIGRMSVSPPGQGGVGRYDTAAEVNVYRDDQLPDIAGWLLSSGTVDETRYPVVRVGWHYPAVASDPALSTALLDLDVDDRFQIINPMPGQTPDTIDQLALGYTETIRPFEHVLAINAAPASPYETSVLNDPASRLDTSGSDLTASITTTATSFQVDTPSGALWTTNPADMPMPIKVGGEVISVGAVSGTSSPQTFSSVTRSVNGIVKAHGAGAALSLANPRVLGL